MITINLNEIGKEELYRDNLCCKIKKLRSNWKKEDALSFLKEAQETQEYIKARTQNIYEAKCHRKNIRIHKERCKNSTYKPKRKKTRESFKELELIKKRKEENQKWKPQGRY